MAIGASEGRLGGRDGIRNGLIETCHAQTLHELTLVSLTVVLRPTGSGRWPSVNGITRRSDVACR
jgi:hypothetical protein